MSALVASQFPPGLAQTNIFKAFTTKDFNNKFDIYETSKIDMNAAAHSIGALLRKHELNDLLGVCNIHNHFKLNDNEIVLARVNQNQVQLKALSADSNLAHGAVPYMWAIDKEAKTLFAYQFFDGKCDAIVERFTALAERTQNLIQFYADFIDLSTKFGLEDVLGIFLIYKDLINYGEGEESLLEETNIDLRVQRMLPAPINEKAIITHWSFANDKTEMGSCNGYCVPDNNGGRHQHNHIKDW